METKKLDEIISNLESLKELNQITESGKETLIELNVIKNKLNLLNEFNLFFEEIVNDRVYIHSQYFKNKAKRFITKL